MSNNRIKRLALGLVLMMAMGVPAQASNTIGISGRVKTVCTVDLAGGSASPSTNGEINLGLMTELCNNLGGYRLVLHHPAGLDQARLMISGQPVALRPNATSTVIVDQDRPTYRQRQLLLVGAQDMTAMNLSLEAQPKGVVF